MKEKQVYKIGKTLGISETDVKAALVKNKNKIIAGLIIGVFAIATNKVWFEPMHYGAASIADFDFLTRFF